MNNEYDNDENRETDNDNREKTTNCFTKGRWATILPRNMVVLPYLTARRENSFPFTAILSFSANSSRDDNSSHTWKSGKFSVVVLLPFIFLVIYNF